MRSWPILLIASATLACAAGAQSAGPSTPNTERMKACAARWNALKRTGANHGQTYRQFCQQALRPAAGGQAQAGASASARPGGPPPGATARCRDGSFTTVARGKSGACSGHGGVAAWL